jgi:sterol desaturase/sphingolipid hydroxylase (fatty acid hydroxylase superfamily)
MNSWLIWCGVTGLVLGCRWPVQAVILVAGIVLAAGVAWVPQWGVAAGLAMVVGGIVVLQLAYMISSLATLLISQSVIPSSAFHRHHHGTDRSAVMRTARNQLLRLATPVALDKKSGG